jgi:hypothetical protein
MLALDFLGMLFAWAVHVRVEITSVRALTIGSTGKSNGLFHRLRAPTLSLTHTTGREFPQPRRPPDGSGWPCGLVLGDGQPAPR